MNLTAQQLSEVVACLRQPGTSSGGQENRRFNRLQVHASVRITTLVDQQLCKSYTVLMRDISFNGLGFVQTSPAQLNEQFITHLPLPSHKILFILCRAARCHNLADSLFDIGAEFLNPPDKHLMEQLLEATDRRLQQVRASILR